MALKPGYSVHDCRIFEISIFSFVQFKVNTKANINLIEYNYNKVQKSVRVSAYKRIYAEFDPTDEITGITGYPINMTDLEWIQTTTEAKEYLDNFCGGFVGFIRIPFTPQYFNNDGCMVDEKEAII